MSNEQLLQYATVKIRCNGETGTALLYSPGETLEYLYILTAKHCLVGKNFDKVFNNTDIKVEKIFNPESGEWHSCDIIETDKIICTENNDLDLALIIIPKLRIEELSGLQYLFQVMDRPGLTGECLIRGFADFNSGEEDRPYKLNFAETVKDRSGILSLEFSGSLDTRYQSALDNVQGLSGSGLFTFVKGHLFLLGTVHTYEEKSRFFATKVTLYNYLIPAGYQQFYPVEPEENDAVLNAFDLIGINNEAIKVKTRDSIGDLHVERDTGRAKKMLEEHGMVVFNGKPGVGKSAMAKKIVNEIEVSKDTKIITFTAEQLYSASLNESLIKAGYSATMNQIISSPLSRQRVVFWIESFEKLVEARFGGAFTELLALVKGNRRLSLMVTIREYFLQKFKIFYQHELPPGDIYFHVNEFNDEEMSQIEAGRPELSQLLSNPKLTHLFRTPYYLDKALRILPQLAGVENLDEAEFKRLLWEEIVEAGERQRGITFQKIAVQRAMAMELFATYDSDTTTDALVRDNILHVEKGELKNRFAPAHDILEDWALILEVKKQRRDTGTPQALLEQLDNGPAMRRAFRLWLEDYYKQQPEAADSFSNEVLSSTAIDQSWKDELIVYILRSENAYPLFNSYRKNLLENKGLNLYHFIQLLRTSCKALRKGAEDFDDLIPTGSGWDAMIEFIHSNKAAISTMPKVMDAITDVLLDWGKQLAVYNPRSLPVAARSAALLSLDYVVKHQSLFTGFRRRNSAAEAHDQALRLLLKLTSVAQEEVKRLLNAVVGLPALNDNLWTNSKVLEYTKDFVVDGVYGEQVSRYFPETVLSLAMDKWIEKPVVHRPGSLISLLEVEYDFRYFGLDDHLNYEASSAYQTFFYWMLLYHPEKAVAFATGFLNVAFEKNQRGKARRGDNRESVILDFGTKGERSYYGGYDYWTFYRGHNAYDSVIQSLLMALEKGLIVLAGGLESHEKIKVLIERLVLDSNNVSVLAVVSSVIQAHPKLLDAKTAVLLGSRPLLDWDSSRYATDMLDKEYYGTNALFRSERLQSNILPHRFAYHRGLIGFVVDYMFVHQEMNKQLFAQLDLLWAQVKQEDFMWRKTLTEMDARKYKIEHVTISGYENHVAFAPGYDPDVAEVISNFTQERVPVINMIWASKVFKKEPVDDKSYDAWKMGYEDLQTDGDSMGLYTAPGKMACLGLRDYYEELKESEKIWCRDTIIQLSSQQLEDDQGYTGMMRASFMDKDALLYGVSLLFRLEDEYIDEAYIRSLIFQLLTTYIDGNEKSYLLLGIAENLWKLRPEFAINCWYGLHAFIAATKEEQREREQDRLDVGRSRSFKERPDASTWKADLVSKVISDTAFICNIEPHLDYATRKFLDDALRMIPVDTEIEPVRLFVNDMFVMHLNYLGITDIGNRDDFWESREVFKTFYAKYLLCRTEEVSGELFKELLDITLQVYEGLDMFNIIEYVRDVIKQLIVAIDSWPTDDRPVSRFWHLWYMMRDWIATTNRAYLIPTVLLESNWHEYVDDWRIIKTEKIFYQDFILRYGINAVNQCIDLLAGPGFKTFMPESVSWLAAVLKYETTNLVRNSKLERFVHRAFFGYNSQIKDDKRITEDFIYILNFLINRGSPKAYMLKEEIIQYKKTDI